MAYDFWITGVNKGDKHIDYVRVQRKKVTANLGPARIVDRGFVADLIRGGKATFCTSVKNSEGKWQEGARVHVIEEDFLTTDPNDAKRDNLGNLQEF